MPEITCWSRRTACSGRAPCAASSSRSGGGSGHASGPSVAIASSSSTSCGAQDLDPRGLLRPELAQAQLAPLPSGDPDEQPRGAVAQRRALVVELQAPRGHQVHEQGEVAGDVDDDVLAAAPDARRRRAVDRVQRRVERLQRVDARRERGLDRRAAQRRVEAARSDLDLGQLGHMIRSSDRADEASARSGLRRRAAGRRRRPGRTARPRPRAAAGTPRGAAGPCGRRGRSSSRRRSRAPRRCGR